MNNNDVCAVRENKDHFIQTIDDNCVGCNRCIRLCPTDTANIAFQDEDGNTKVQVDPSHCILCGSCVRICEHNARKIIDDTDFFSETSKTEFLYP